MYSISVISGCIQVSFMLICQGLSGDKHAGYEVLKVRNTHWRRDGVISNQVAYYRRLGPVTVEKYLRHTPPQGLNY